MTVVGLLRFASRDVCKGAWKRGENSLNTLTRGGNSESATPEFKRNPRNIAFSAGLQYQPSFCVDSIALHDLER